MQIFNKIGMIIEIGQWRGIVHTGNAPERESVGVRFLQEMCRTYLGVSAWKCSVKPALMVSERIVDDYD